MDPEVKKFLKRLAWGIGVRVIANAVLPGMGEHIAHSAAHAADGAHHAADAAQQAADAAHHTGGFGVKFGEALGTAGRFLSDYLGPDGTRLHTDAAGNMYNPATGDYFTRYSAGVSYSPMP